MIPLTKLAFTRTQLGAVFDRMRDVNSENRSNWVSRRANQLADFRFGANCGLKSDIARGLIRANKRHCSVTERTRSPQTGRPGRQLTGADWKHKVHGPWRVTEARRESQETHAPWACDADLPGFKFLIRCRCAQYCLRGRECVGNSVMALRSVGFTKLFCRR